MTIAPTQPQQVETPQNGLVQTCEIGSLTLESLEIIPQVNLAFETWGELNERRDNAVLILHALTGDTHVSRADITEDSHTTSPTQPAGWWEGIVGPGCVIDTEKYFVLAPNILGGCYGSTGPSSPTPESIDSSRKPWGSRFPLVTIRDTVYAEAHLADALGIETFYAVVGGSLGGARAMEWALTYPHRVEHCVVIASGPSATADQIAWAQSQNLAISLDPNFAGGDYYDGLPPEGGLGLARRIAHTTYRSAPELHFRFGRVAQRGERPLQKCQAGERGRYAVESYLDYHAKKLADRFDANSYLVINNALISHDITRGRGSLTTALAASTCEWNIAYVDSDRLFYPSESIVMAASLPQPGEAMAILSPSGHDGFLVETDQIERVLRRTF